MVNVACVIDRSVLVFPANEAEIFNIPEKCCFFLQNVFECS